jgi:acetyl-CoA C-acetyltransferase/acetyl-CoA acyltransferase
MSPRIAGVSLTDFGKHPERSSRELFTEAAGGALADAGVTADDVEAVFVGNFTGELTEDQGHMGPMMADYLGARSAAAMRVENACASGGVAVRQAVEAVASGMHDVALAGGVEMMHNVGIADITDALANAGDNEYENEIGLTFPGIYALMARRYLHEFDADHADLAAITVKNRENARDNPIAQFRESVTVAEALEGRPIASPLTMYDACPITDGAAAVVVVSREYADEGGLDAPVTVAGTGQASDTIALQDRAEIARTEAAERAAEEAYERAGVGPADVDVAEVHDCFTIAEVLAVESLGFFERGEGYRGASEGETTVDGSIPVNTSGGLIAKGHPVGATGAAQVAELTKQLEGRHPNQVDDASVGLAHNVGGSGASAVVTVLRRD